MTDVSPASDTSLYQLNVLKFIVKIGRTSSDLRHSLLQGSLLSDTYSCSLATLSYPHPKLCFTQAEPWPLDYFLLLCLLCPRAGSEMELLGGFGFVSALGDHHQIIDSISSLPETRPYPLQSSPCRDMKASLHWPCSAHPQCSCKSSPAQDNLESQLFFYLVPSCLWL